MDPKKEIERCKRDFWYFCRKYLYVVSKTAKLVKLHARPEQRAAIEALERNPWLYILKARQIGYTTIVAARLFHRALFTPNHRVAVTAQDGDAAAKIFNEKYVTFYKHLPPFLKFPLVEDSANKMVLFHGGSITVGSGDSNKWHGSTYHDIHATEFSRYRDIEKFVKAVFQTAGPNASIILETTANGHNEAKKLWDEDNGFEKMFVGWTQHKKYSLRSRPKGMRVSREMQRYAKEHKLTRGQTYWAQKTLNGKCFKRWRTFREQYPNTAEEAFVSSGDRVYPDNIYFSGVTAKTGLTRHQEGPQNFHIYTIGVDTASGASDGDYCAFHVLDVTNKALPRSVASYYQRVKPYDLAQQAHAEAKHWDALAVIEDNSYGAAVAQHFINEGYAHLYRRVKHDKLEDRWQQTVGFQTNVKTRPIMLRRLYEFIVEGKLQVIDDTLKAELNSFVYDLRGIAEKENQRPTNVRELLEFELAMGKIYSHCVGSAQSAVLQPVERPPVQELLMR